ncbi:MAG: hypothetical protein EPN70_18860 [Paraburkholderia sp.]|jgi:hypothetical protein|uniref:hypothetical protein n=1 Tax=Paraburkholderia sp. TaxID=1926495 RepID=UPI0012171EE3|nr:hypothetical protein [Paraburkholderia sp.]TAM01717.1 MAG: hypothetical protein EPN70_18860 [Paraburkholderia sp.]
MHLIDRNGRPIISAEERKRKGLHILAATVICSILFGAAACAGLVGGTAVLFLIVAFAGAVGFATPLAIAGPIPPASLWLMVVCWAWVMALPFGITAQLGFAGLVGIPLALGVTHTYLFHRWKNQNHTFR